MTHMLHFKVMLLTEILSNIKKIAANTPDRAAIFDQGRELSYSQFHTAIRSMADTLIRASVRPGDRVGLYLDNSIEAYVSLYAIAGMGCTYVPLPTQDPTVRLREVIKDADLSAIVCLHEQQITVGQLIRDSKPSVQTITVSQEVAPPSLSMSMSDDDWIQDQSANDVPVYILYTSGSTGVPKGVAISRSNVRCFNSWAADYLKIGPSDRFLAHPRITFDLSVINLFLPFLCGASVVILRGQAQMMLPGEALSDNITIAAFVPRVTSSMIQAGQLTAGAYPKLRHILFSGENLPSKYAALWLQAGPQVQVHNLYGPTEATVSVTFHTLSSKTVPQGAVPIGIPMPGTRLRILSAHGEEIQRVGEGELIICGEQVSPFGYWRKDAGGFHWNPQGERCFRTGDWVRLTESGQLVWLNRLDNQVKVRGFRVELGEVESVLCTHSEIREGVCLYFAETEKLVFVFARMAAHARKSSELPETLMKLASDQLPSYMRPTQYLEVEDIPKNENGKADRKRLCLEIGCTP